MSFSDTSPAVKALIADLESRVLGIELPEWSCSCGSIHIGPAIAARLEMEKSGEPARWYCWKVQMRDLQSTRDGEYSYTISLDRFIPHEELKRIFHQHFGDGDTS